MTALSAPPSLLPLYARAAVTAPLHRGDALPDSVYSLADQKIDARHLAAYDRVCGFRVGDVLPATYLHVLAFPLSVALMVEQSFPFPLVGLVHVANSITVHRRVTVEDTVSFTVRADNLRDHPAGRQFDLLAEASVDGEPVWSGRSAYLRRAGKPPARPSADRNPTPTPDVPSGPVSYVRVPADVGRKYAAVSGDRNPIHLFGLTAKAFGFPSAIAHGMWLKARTLATLEGRLPSGVAIAATRAGDAWSLDVRNARSGKPHLSGSVTPR
jgi:hypothetical protein